MNAFFMVCLVLAVATGVAAVWAHRIDEAERDWCDIDEWHLLHGPTDGCRECADK